jgi:hypothetical protein
MKDDKEIKTKNKEDNGENKEEQLKEGKGEKEKKKGNPNKNWEDKSREEKDRSKELLDREVVIPGGEVTVRGDGKSNWGEAYKWFSPISAIDRKTLDREVNFIKNRLTMLEEEEAFLEKRSKRLRIKFDEMVQEGSDEYGNAGKYKLDDHPPGMTQE